MLIFFNLWVSKDVRSDNFLGSEISKHRLQWAKASMIGTHSQCKILPGFLGHLPHFEIRALVDRAANRRHDTRPEQKHHVRRLLAIGSNDLKSMREAFMQVTNYLPRIGNWVMPVVHARSNFGQLHVADLGLNVKGCITSTNPDRGSSTRSAMIRRKSFSP